MKKITLLAVAVIAVSFASCKKAKTCTCTRTQTQTSNGISTSSTSSDVISYDKISSEDANIMCPKTKTGTFSNGNSTYINTTACTLS